MDNEKISVRQAMLFFIVLFCAPAIRYIPLYTCEQAQQAAWLAPLITFVLELIYMSVWWRFLKRYEKKSFVYIIKDILGKIFGNTICICYFLWITLMLAYNLRMYAERIVSSAMVNVNIIVILLVMLIIVGYVMKKGIVTVAKMNELFFLGIAGMFILYNFLILPEINVQNLFPITYKDILPIFKATFCIISVFGYNVLIFMFNDQIDYKTEFKKVSIKTINILTIFSLFVIGIPLSVFGWSIISKMRIPYLSTMMQINLFDIIERIESGLIMIWIITDFILVYVFIYSAIHMIKVSFNLCNVKPLVNIYILGILLLSVLLAKTDLELKIFSGGILTPMNI
ncbi:MAG: GerAB/ArcD/ProY family transporter, partial [Bacilli bacterium]|nr:GerAB/ArcD/ProY family transporter [Bacilli bacterium]